MRKLKAWASDLPRPAVILVNLIVIAALLVLRYVFAGTPARSIEQAYRRAERGNLVGPAEILDTIPVDMRGYDRLLIADDGDGVILYTALSGNGSSGENGMLVYREKAGGVTVVPAPAEALTFTGTDASLPVIVFDEYPEAIRAELDLTLHETDTGADVPGALEFHLQAERETEGYFRFEVSWSGEARFGKEVQMINDLGRLSTHNTSLSCAYPAAVRLFDAQNVMIYEQTLMLRTRAGYAHAPEEKR